jgi:hypothetical protein
VWALAALALCGDASAIALGLSALRVADPGPFSRRGLSRAAVVLGVVGLVGVLVVAYLGFSSFQCGHQFEGCREGWTR